MKTSTIAISLVSIVHYSQHVASDELTLFNWEDYISEEVIELFSKESGHTVKVVLYDSDNERDEILATGGSAVFDVAVMDSTSVVAFAKQNLLEILNETKIPNLKHLGSQWRNSCGQYSVPYFWGTMGLAYRSDKIESIQPTWRTLITPDDSLKGHIGMLSDYSDTIIPALKLLNFSINTSDKNELKEAFALLQQQKPSVLTYQYILSFVDNHKSSDNLYLALAYSGDIYSLNQGEEGPWQYVIPEEGTSLWVDCLTVMKSSSQKQAAKAFVDFLSRPDIAALNANDIGSATTNDGALNKIDAELLNDTTLYPSENVMNYSETYQVLSDDNIRLRNRIVETLERHATQ